VDRFFPCACRAQCVAGDGSSSNNNNNDKNQSATSDTCSGHGVGCSEAGDCLCKRYFTGKHCELPLVPTGEINQRNYDDLSDRGTDLCKALFLVGAATPPPPPRESPRSITAVALASVLDLCGTAAPVPNNTFGSPELAIWNQTYSMFTAARDAHREGEEQTCPEPFSRLCVVVRAQQQPCVWGVCARVWGVCSCARVPRVCVRMMPRESSGLHARDAA
jgi:hypothetical protein